VRRRRLGRAAQAAGRRREQGIGARPLAQHPAAAETAEALAREAYEAARGAGLREAHLLGVSLGGIVAQELALGAGGAEAEVRWRSLVLCSTTPGGRASARPPSGFLETFARWREGEAARREVAAAFLAGAASPQWLAAQPSHRRLLAHTAERFASTPREPSAIAAQAAAVHAALASEPDESCAARLGEMRRRGDAPPALVLHGDADSVFPPSNAELLQSLLGPPCAVKFLPGCGHLPYFEQPRAFVKVVTKFLARCEAGEFAAEARAA